MFLCRLKPVLPNYDEFWSEDLMPRGVYLFIEGDKEGEEWMYGMILEHSLSRKVYNAMLEKRAGMDDDKHELFKRNGITFRDFDDLKDMAGALAGGMALLIFGREGSVVDRRKPVEDDDEEASSEAEEVSDAG